MPYLAVLLLAGGMYLTGMLVPLERALMDMRFHLLQRDASGGLIIVQIDAQSLRELGVWPWPRDFHAKLIEQLFAAGVREVALDIDLSAQSNPEADRAFARALRNHDGQVILPAFRQQAAPGTERQEIIESTPLSILRENAQIGAVNMTVEPDGLIRRAFNSIVIEGQNHASMFTLLAGPAYLDRNSFLIDYSIDPWTIPRISYADVLRGDVASERLYGKRILVGSGAAELGDNFAVPIYRTIPGPVVQALAYESLVQGRAIRTSGASLALVLGTILVLVIGPYFNRTPWKRGAVVAGVTILNTEVVAILILGVTPFSVDTTLWHALTALCFAQSVFRLVNLQDLQLFRQRMAIQYRRRLMNLVVQDSFDGVIITDANGHIEVINKSAAELLSYNDNANTARSLRHVFPIAYDFVQKMGTVSDGANETAVVHSGPHECHIEASDGKRIDVELVISRFQSGLNRSSRERNSIARQNYSLTFRNITERKLAQNAERTATEQAQAANRAKTEFLANMSHELRTPLNAILGFSDLIRSEVAGPIAPEQYGPYIDHINDSGRHLLDVINDILDVSRIELGQIQLNEDAVDLKATSQAVCRILSGWPASADRTLEIQFDPDLPAVFADARLIKQILVNLLSNAVKYSESGDMVSLRVFVDPDGDPTIEVADTGVGIEPEVIPLLTKPFYQVDGSFTRSQEGSGLGLCLVAAYVELHGGNLKIDSQPGVGTKITVSFPQARIIENPQQSNDSDSRAVGV